MNRRTSMSDTIAPAAAPTETSLDRMAGEMSALARSLASETDRGRCLSDELVHGLRSSGLFRAGPPLSGGAQRAPPAETLRCAEEVARGDASAGWCVSIAATSSLLGGWLSDEGLAEIFGDPASVAAGVWGPRGSARRVEGGYRVLGRWG